MILSSLMVFLFAIATDFSWAIYMRRVAAGKALSAAVWSVVIAACGAVTVVSYVQNRSLLLPMLAGYFVGTFVSVWRDTK